MKPRKTNADGKRKSQQHWILLVIGALVIGLLQAPLSMAASTQSQIINQKIEATEYHFSSTAQQVNGDQIAAAIADVQQRRQRVNQLLNQTKNTTQVLKQLHELQQNEDLSFLQRDLTIHTYAMALRQMREADVDPDLLQWLKHYPHQAWRHHDESNHYRIPAVNVAAAIDGTQNEWNYLAGQSMTATAAVNTRLTMERYAQATESFQRGFDASVSALNPQDREALLRHLMAHPQLSQSRIAGLLALSHGNKESTLNTYLRQWANHAAPNAALDVLRQASSVLSQSAFLDLCQHLTQHPDDSVYGVALAQAAQHWQREPLDATQKQAWQQLLKQQLSDPVRGVAAAHQLAKLSSHEDITKWQTEATSSLAQQRFATLAAQHTGGTNE